MEKVIDTRKQRGKLAEELVDAYMNGRRYVTFVKNLYFKGGEIDRVYLSNNNYCVCEIKSVHVRSSKQIINLFSEIEFKRLLKPKQIANLQHYASLYLPIEAKVHFRLFLVVECSSAITDDLISTLLPTILFKAENTVLFTIEPEFVFRKPASLLQTEFRSKR